MVKIKESLKKINYKMFAVLLLFGLIPAIYTTVRIFLIGQLPEGYAFSIAGQLQWVNLLYEILQEALILPLFFFIGAVVSNKNELANRVKTGLLFTFAIYTTLSALIFIFAKPLVVFMAQDTTIVDVTVSYIRLETIAMIFSTLVKFMMVVLVTIKKEKNMYIVLVIQLILTILFDVFFVSTLPVSLNLGINGIAYSNIIVNIILLLLSICLLYQSGVNIFNREKFDVSWFKDLFKKGGISGLESLVRNLAFMLMVVRMVNVVGEQGTFWVANNFIWVWLLMPVLQLGELIKADTGNEGYNNISERSLGYFTITIIIVITWFITIPLWEPFTKNILQITNYNDVLKVVYISLGFYVLFAINNVVDSYFYGLGKTSYMLFQSIVINTVFYGALFILFQLDVIHPTLNFIALMFAIGIGLDSVLTMGMFKWMLKKEKNDIFALST